ncbi:roadblock/LC7 domain-containing protein [Methanoculleus sp. 7T]|uniref:roadblock/LC7 domain-containing protein n=1 Tax=Methanoculleus sp. 7T TaxID=2937282 RepID=UPI0020BE9CCC|nr:roadblock/LC7 domain-containing protein [Methanoculleus sp. 7T]MCK8518289.1 roadblock/LC7 domain-containing protein [Methanoculleus sp. 7T]
MSHHPFAGENAQKYIDEIRSVVGVVACALVSCEGLVMGKYFRDGSLSSSLFAAMSATVLASAEAACGSVHVQRPSMVTITATDAVILVVRVGEVALIVAVIDMSADLPTVQRRLLDIAVGIGEEA